MLRLSLLIAIMWSNVFLVACSSSPKAAATAPATPIDPKGAIIDDISTLGADLYNANFVGKPCTTVDSQTTCPGGGNVHITGSFSCSTGSNDVQNLNLNFSYDMTSCIVVANNLTLTLTGTMTHTGSSSNVSSIVSAETINYQAQTPVKIVAVGATGSNYAPFNNSCAFALVAQKASVNSTEKVSGVICGTSVGLH